MIYFLLRFILESPAQSKKKKATVESARFPFSRMGSVLPNGLPSGKVMRSLDCVR